MQLREAICHFSLENVVPITHGQNIICSKTRLDGTTHEQTIICRQLFAGHVVDSRPIKRDEKTHRKINGFVHAALSLNWLTRRLQTIRKHSNERTNQ